MSTLKEARAFLLGEFLSWAFWKFWGLPVVATAFYLAVSYVSGQWGPLTVLGVVFCFAVGCGASAALEHREYLREARAKLATKGGGTLPEVREQIKPKRGGPPPVIVVEPIDSEEGFLLVKNTGGDAMFSAIGRIIQVVKPRSGHGANPEEVRIGHTAPFKMIWKDSDTHQIVKGHKLPIAADQDAKLLLAFKRRQQIGSGRGLAIYGDGRSVDQYWVNYGGEPTPIITIEIEIKSEPPLLVAFKEGFTVQQTKSGEPVLVRASASTP